MQGPREGSFGVVEREIVRHSSLGTLRTARCVPLPHNSTEAEMIPDWKEILADIFAPEVVPPALIKELEIVAGLTAKAGGALVSRQAIAVFVVNWAARNGVSYKVARLIR